MSETSSSGSSLVVTESSSRIRHDLRLVTLAWVFGAVWMWTISGAAMTQFAKALNTPEWAFGIIGMIPSVGVLLQLPAGWFMERYGYRKLTFLILLSINRLLWLVIAAIPWLFPRTDARGYITLLTLLFISWCAGNACGPAWLSWMADVIPRKLRGRYFGFRNRIGQLMGILATVSIGIILDHAAAQTDRPELVLKTASVLLVIAGILGTIDIQFFWFVRDDYPRPKRPDDNIWSMIRQPLADANFCRFLAFNFLLNLAIVGVGQYIWLYNLNELHMSNTQAQMMIIVLPLLVQMMAYPIWGKMVDRLGRKPVLLFAGSVVILGALGWLLMTPEVSKPVDWSGPWTSDVAQMLGSRWHWRSWIGYLTILITTFCWPGVEIANFNVTLDLAGNKKSAGSSAAYVAVNSIACAVGGVLSGLLAGLTAESLHGWRYAIPIMGITLTYHSVLFILSMLLRALAVVQLWQFEEPKAKGTRAAIEFMSQEIYANIRQAAILPSRIVEHASRWTFLTSVPFQRQIRFGGFTAPKRWWRKQWRKPRPPT